MGQAQDQVATLQKFIDGVPDAARVIHEAVGRADLPDEARRVLVGALNYMLDLLDIFPDHYKGLGLADDAAVLRVAARQAVEAGASGDDLTKLAREADDVAKIFTDLAEPFGKLVAQMPDRNVRGRTAAQILASKDLRAGFDGDVKRAIGKLAPGPIDVSHGPERAIQELLKMVQAAVRKAGVA